jgi:hypothetical protein
MTLRLNLEAVPSNGSAVASAEELPPKNYRQRITARELPPKNYWWAVGYFGLVGSTDAVTERRWQDVLAVVCGIFNSEDWANLSPVRLGLPTEWPAARQRRSALRSHPLQGPCRAGTTLARARLQLGGSHPSSRIALCFHRQDQPSPGQAARTRLARRCRQAVGQGF